MNTFLKILLYVVLAILVIKLFPLTLALGVLLALAVGGALFVGFSMVAVLVGLALAAVAALAPLWLPALAIVGAIALFKKTGAKTA